MDVVRKIRNFRHLFVNEDEEVERVAVENARKVLDWMQQDYHSVFEGWLEREASKPLPIDSQHMDLVQSAVRANTMKEVRTHLSTLRKKSIGIMQETREVTDG